MKKNYFILFAIFILISLTSSCNLQFSGSNLLTKPDVEPKNDQITVSIPLQSTTTSYINVYRKKSSDDDDDAVNLGIIYPSAFSSTASSYIFNDYLIVEDTTYLYKARYKESDGYYTTNWSSEVTSEGGYSSTDSLSYDEGSASFTYSSTDYSLTIDGTITAPDITDFSTDYEPMLIVSTEDETQTFYIDSVDDAQVIDLKDILPADFLDTEITIEGITACMKEYTDDTETTTEYLYWIEPTVIPISGNSSRKLTIPSSESTDGYDYSQNVQTVQ